MSYLKDRRLKLNFTQQQLADLLGVRKQTVSEWERGNSIPRYQSLVKLKEILGLETIDFLLEQESDTSQQNNIKK